MIYTVTFNPAIDYVVQLDSPLEIGGVNRASAEHCVLGGKGINVSGVLTELGCGNVALGFVAGETGAWLERGLVARGQRTDFIRLDSGMTRINVKIKGAEETELNGAGPQITPEAMGQLYRKLDALLPGDVLVLAGSIPACAPGHLSADPDPAEGEGVWTARCHRAAADECSALPPFPDQAEPSRAGRATGVGRCMGTRRSPELPVYCSKKAHGMCW